MAEQPMCVFCRRHPLDPRWRPFCSERCKLQDLARWADGRYRVAGDRTSRPNDGDDDETRDE
ncbi:MAG TPA: DNA gyrase inhibitor YacG [Vicinamibacterales bacterium]|nr:DNA gyrase inhibitor YacG [Vicinamibacterales bacterium]